MKQNETPNATFDNDDMVSISRDFRKLIENKVCVCVCVHKTFIMGTKAIHR